MLSTDSMLSCMQHHPNPLVPLAQASSAPTSASGLLAFSSKTQSVRQRETLEAPVIHLAWFPVPGSPMTQSSFESSD